jgi:thiol-disulfide isomerase/thioredoxin
MKLFKASIALAALSAPLAVLGEEAAAAEAKEGEKKVEAKKEEDDDDDLDDLDAEDKPAEKAEEAPAAVHTLTDANFKEWIKQHPTAIVKFYAPWCGHCKAMAPAYEAAAKRLAAAKRATQLADVDATIHNAVAHQVSHFAVKSTS